MYFGLPDDALVLREGLREVLATACTPAVIRAAWDGSDCAELWKELGAFGLLGLLVAEDRGGLGLDELSFVAACEQLGYAGAPGPVVETIISLPALDVPLDGSARVTVMQSLGPFAYPGSSTHLLDVAAYNDPGTRPALTDLATARLTISDTVDRSRGQAVVSGRATDAGMTEHQRLLLRHRGTLGTAAFLLGLARRQIEMTVAYVKDRRQFGVPVGSFQAIKHPIADAVVGTEFAWPAVLRAAQSLADDDPQAAVHVSMAKALASDAAYTVSRVCLQAHGAMGYTVEYDLHLFAKRTWALAKDWGTADHHRALVADALLERTDP